MACRDEGQGAVEAARREVAMQGQIDKLTRMLCAVLTKNPFAAVATAEVADWWRDHQLADERRKKSEQEKKEREDSLRQSRIAELEAELARLKEQR